MAIYYANKAQEIRTNGGNVIPTDTGGRIRIAFDTMTIGSGNIPNPLPTISSVNFLGAGLPKGARVVGAIVRWEVLDSGVVTFSVTIKGNGGTQMLLRDSSGSVSMDGSAKGSAFLTPTTATEETSDLTDAAGMIPVMLNAGEMDTAGEVSVSILYVLD